MIRFCVFAFCPGSALEGCNQDCRGSAWIGHGPVSEDPRTAAYLQGLTDEETAKHVCIPFSWIRRLRRCNPSNRGRQRHPLLQRLVINRPVRGLVIRKHPTAHALLLSRWIRKMNPNRRFVQQSEVPRKITLSGTAIQLTPSAKNLRFSCSMWSRFFRSAADLVVIPCAFHVG